MHNHGMQALTEWLRNRDAARGAKSIAF